MCGSLDGLKYAGGKVEAAWSASFHVVKATPQQRTAESVSHARRTLICAATTAAASTRLYGMPHVHLITSFIRYLYNVT